MYISDDAKPETIVREVVEALKESARHIGKVARTFRKAQIQEIELAILALQATIDRKKGLTNADRT